MFCQSFYICVNGVMNTIACPSGTLFDSNLGKCNYANAVSCPENQTTIAMATTSGIKQKI